MKIERSIYFQNLDALRGIAALAVVFYHCTLWLPHSSKWILFDNVISFRSEGGFFGVVFFFVLSGFLITYLILDEVKRKDSFAVMKFYMRRVIRIWPLYILTLMVGFIFYPLLFSLMGWAYEEQASLFLYATFLANFDVIYNGAPTTGLLGVHWSVAIEEQFYLLWPSLFVLKYIRRKIIWILIALFIFSWWYTFYQLEWNVLYYHSLSNMKFLVFGAILAFILFYKSDKLNGLLQGVSPFINVVIYGFFIILLLWISPLADNKYVIYLGHFISMIFFGYVIIEQVSSSRSFYKVGRINFLNFIGKISYGIYLLHMISIYIVLNLFPSEQYYLIKIVVVILTTIGLSFLSYKFFESYFLRFKKHFIP